MLKKNESQAAAAVAAEPKESIIGNILVKYSSVIILIIMIIISAIISPLFLTKNNIMNVLRQQAPYAVVSMGLLMCLMSGHIDLSVSSMVGLGCCMVTWLSVKLGLPITLSVILTLVGCAFFGAINGTLVAFMKMPAFIATLAMSYGLQGLAYIISGTLTMFVPNDTAAGRLFLLIGQKSDPIIGVPYRCYIALVVVIVFWFITKFTSYGRMVVATGSNARAVELAGISTKKYTFLVYVVEGFLGGLAGLLVCFANGASTPTICAGDYGMFAIAGTVIGGATMDGGTGSVIFALVGVFVMGLINNIMNLISVPAWPQWCVKAVVIILAIFLRGLTRRKQ